MYKIIAFACLFFFCSCKEQKNNDTQILHPQRVKPIKTFCSVEKDSASFTTYEFSKQFNNSSFSYIYSNIVNSFVVIWDTTNNIFRLSENKKDTNLLFIEDYRLFNINGKDYKVFKLIAGKDITDGEDSYFFNFEYGVLLRKSNTWRIGQILNPDKTDSQYLELTTILYRILIEESFYTNHVPVSKKKFTPPKIE